MKLFHTFFILSYVSLLLIAVFLYSSSEVDASPSIPPFLRIASCLKGSSFAHNESMRLAVTRSHIDDVVLHAENSMIPRVDGFKFVRPPPVSCFYTSEIIVLSIPLLPRILSVHRAQHLFFPDEIAAFIFYFLI